MGAVGPKPSGRYPVAPKTQAAGLGGLSGASVAAAVIGLVEQYGTHAALPGAAQTAIYLACSAVIAAAAAYFAPHQDRAPAPARTPARRVPDPPVTQQVTDSPPSSPGLTAPPVPPAGYPG